MTSAAIREAAEELMGRYARSIDADRLEDWLELFTEDASYQILSRENVEQKLPVPIVLCRNKRMIRDRIVALRNATKFRPHYDRHLIGRVHVEPEAEGMWRLEANYALFQTGLDGQSKLFSVGCYLDKSRMENGRLLFCEKKVVVDTFSVPSHIATPI